MLARLGVTDVITCVPFISHSAMAPLSLRQRMSDWASPLKSPICTMCQDASGATTLPCEVIKPLDVIAEPFICHSAIWPALLRQSMSALPSSLKSPTPTMVHDGSTRTGVPPEVTSPLAWISVSDISHIETSPPVLRHTMSPEPLPSKSPTPATLHDLSGAGRPDRTSLISAPRKFHSTSWLVVALRHRTARSSSPSVPPAKSPTAATLQGESSCWGAPLSVTGALAVMVDPSISHSTS